MNRVAVLGVLLTGTALASDYRYQIAAPAVVTLPVYGVAASAGSGAAADEEVKALLRQLIEEVKALRVAYEGKGGGGAPPAPVAKVDPLAARHALCSKCHSDPSPRGDVAFFNAAGTQAYELNGPTKKAILRYVVEAKKCPPPGSPQPNAAQLAAIQSEASN